MADDTQTVGVWDPQRKEKVQVPKNVADNLVRTGYSYKMGDDADKEEFDQGSGGAALATAHSYVNSLGFGLPDVAAANVPSLLGGDSVREGLKRVHHQEDIHSNLATTGDVAGYFGPGGLLHLLGKGAEKVGMHALLKAAAEHTPQHLAENLGLETAAKHELGQAATRLAGKAGSAVGFGAEAGIRGAAKEDVDQQLSGTPYDVEKVAQAFGYDALVGGATDASFGLAGEGLRGLRKGVSKAADGLEKTLPFKDKKIGKVEIDPEEIRTVKQRKKRTVTDKTEIRTKTGGGFTEEATTAKARTKEAHSEDTTSSSQATNKGSRSTDNTTKTGNAETINEDIYADPEAPDQKPKVETGIEWDQDASRDDIMGSIRHQLNEKLAGDEVHQGWAQDVIDLEAEIQQHHTNGQFSDKRKAIKKKRELQDYFREHVPGYGELLDEYGNVKNGHYDTFNPASVKDPLKTGKKTTKESFNQQTRTKEGQSSTDTTKESSRVKSASSSDTSEETKAKTRVNEDVKDEKHTRTEQTHEYEDYETVRHKRKFNPLTKKEYHGFIDWRLKGGIAYGSHLVGLSTVTAPMLAADILVPHVINNRSFYSKQLDRMTQKPIEALGKLTRNLTTSKLNNAPSSQAQLSKALRNPDKLYQQVTSSLQAHANDPAATQQAVQHHWGHTLVEHPQLQTGLIVHTQKIAQVAQAHIPSDNRPPTAQHTPYNPPRSQKVKFLRLFHAINQPLSALENPTPQMMQVIEQTNPETLNLVRRTLAGHIAENKAPFKGKAAQVVSMILGEPINPRNDSTYLKRLQDTASLDAPATEPSGGNHSGPHAGSIAGPKSAKVQQDAATLYATPQQLQSLA